MITDVRCDSNAWVAMLTEPLTFLQLYTDLEKSGVSFERSSPGVVAYSYSSCRRKIAVTSNSLWTNRTCHASLALVAPGIGHQKALW